MKNHIILSFLFCLNLILLKGQEIDIYNEDIEISQEDLKDALDLIGLKIFNFKMVLPKDGSYNMVFYRNEYVENELVNEEKISVIRFPYNAFDENENLITKDIEKIRIIINKKPADTDDYSFETSIRGGRGQRTIKTKINKHFESNFDIRPFKLEAPKVGENNPLLLIGSIWKYIRNGKVGYRFCGSNELDADFSNEAFEEMPSYYVIGYKLVKLDDSK